MAGRIWDKRVGTKDVLTLDEVTARIPEGSLEICRLAITPDDRLVVIVGADDAYEGSIDPEAWGMYAVDMLHRMAEFLHDQIGLVSAEGRLSREEILQLMRSTFDAEWEHRTAEFRPLLDS